MKSKILLIVTIVLVIGAAVTVFFLIDASGTNKELEAEKDSLTTQLSDTEAELEDSISAADTLTDENETLTEEKTSLTDTLEGLISDKDGLTDDLEDLQADFDEMLEMTFCPADDYDPLSVSYTTNDDVMEDLMDWTADLHGDSVIDTNWFYLTMASDTAYHYLETGTDWEVFIVFFDDSRAETVDGVFFVRGQCWLSLPSFEE